MSGHFTGGEPEARCAGAEEARARAVLVEVPEAGACPEPMEMAEYIDGAGSAERREAVELHLASCAACRDALADARCAGSEAPSARWARALSVAGRRLAGSWSTAAAAALLAFVAGSASTWWFGAADLSGPVMSADVARLSPSGVAADAGPMSITRGIILTPTQDAALSAIRERDADQLGKFHARLDEINDLLVRELESGEPDRARIGALVQERYEIMGQHLRLEAGQVRDFCTMLTPDQCARLGRSWLGRHGVHGAHMRGGGGRRGQGSPTLPAP